ncbi:MAG: hypothetical protein HKM28_00585 [Flavobacteriaceae bacterium]|nr:hypothetical protein [Flavobacteriaceae bacterium]
MIFISLLFGLSTTGCTVKKFAEELKPSSFITQPKRLAKSKDLPFNLAWVSPEISTRLFGDVIVSAVLSDMVDSDKWVFSAGTFVPTRNNYIERTLEVSDYIQDRVIKRLEEKREERKMESILISKGLPQNTKDEQTSDPDVEPIPYLEPLDRGDRTLLIEVSVSEITFGDPLIYGGLFAAPIPGIANLSTGVKSPSITLEAKFVDKATGVVITEVIDRRFPQIRIIDLNRLIIEQSLKEMSDSFAEDIAELFFNESREKIPGRWPFSILPW